MRAMKPLTGAEVLLLEDEVLLRKRLAGFLEREGAEVASAGSLEEARNFLEVIPADLALLDVNLPDGSGLNLLREQRFSANCCVIVMTADDTVGTAVEAMKLGASDFLVKPFEIAELPLVIERARRSLQSARLDQHRRQQDLAAGDEFYFGPALEGVKMRLEKILQADRRLQEALPPVLVEGETGTGKTTIARLIHHRGPRSAGPLVEVNCSALPEALAESELFGHERGAFTDARKERIGLFEAADGGTLFLDEIPSLSLPLQAKVLTAVEDRRIRRLGGNKTIEVDVRLIAAANCDLRQKAERGEFREDLYHRLDLFRISIPPLRERRPDLLVLVERLLRQIEKRHRLPPREISGEGKRRLLAYRWPGNVRELMHALERAVVFEEEETLQFNALASSTGSASDGWLPEEFVFPEEGFSLEEEINRMIRKALRQTGENVSAAARLLGVSRDFIRYRLAGKREAMTRADGK